MFGLLLRELNSAQAKIIAERMRKKYRTPDRKAGNRCDVPGQSDHQYWLVFFQRVTRNISLVMTEADKAAEAKAGATKWSSYLSAKY